MIEKLSLQVGLKTQSVNVFTIYVQVGMACALADSSDFGLLGEQSSPKFETPCLGCQWTAVQNVTLLALSSAEKPYKKTHKQ